MTTKGTSTEKKKVNQFGDYDDTSDMTIKDWEFRWSKSQTQFHMPKIHPMLDKHFQTITQGKQNLRFFIPLCGKSLDMKWILDKGHEVVGLEAVEKGCIEFFEEQKITYTSEPLKTCKGKVFKSTGQKSNISLYCCDFFDIDRLALGTFDCIWDRGSLVAISRDSRKKYVNKITPLMAPETQYLLDCFLVDNKRFWGPPFDCRLEELETLFGNVCNIKKIDEHDAMGKWQETWGVDFFIEEVYILTRK